MAKGKKRGGGLGGAVLSLAVVLGLVGGAGGADDMSTTEVYETAYVTESAVDYVLETEESVAMKYVEEVQLEAPLSSVACEGAYYEEIVDIFEEAGFVNITTCGKEIAYTTDVINGAVAEIAVGNNSFFDENQGFDEGTPVNIIYYDILPEETVAKTTEVPITSENIEKESTTENKVVEDVSETMVWIPKSGSKYHSRSGCSNMKNPTQVTLEEAIEKGYEACKRCY